MALGTGGTNANNSLSSLMFTHGASAADMAALAVLIKDDLNTTHPVVPGSISANGQLFIPRRGVLRVRAGDYVMIDATTGWPILLSADTIANGNWTHA